jgi:hypothetical protein
MNSLRMAIMSATLFAAGSTVALYVGERAGSLPSTAVVPQAQVSATVPQMQDTAAVPFVQGLSPAAGSTCGIVGGSLGFETRWTFGRSGNDAVSTCAISWAAGYLNLPATAPVA